MCDSHRVGTFIYILSLFKLNNKVFVSTLLEKSQFFSAGFHGLEHQWVFALGFNQTNLS